MTTDARVEPRPGATAPRSTGGRRPRPGPDRVSVVLFSLAAFLTVLALLAMQMRAGAATTGVHRVIVVRKIYRTTVVTTITAGSGPTGTSVAQSQSSSSAPSTAHAPPTTRTS